MHPTITDHAAFTPEAIARMVDTFYGRVRDDEVLGPVFARRVHDWSHHQARMCTFWGAVLRGTGEFRPDPRGAPPALHRAIGELRQAHFERWLALFTAVVRAQFDEAGADALLARAERMRAVLSAHLPHEDAA